MHNIQVTYIVVVLALVNILLLVAFVLAKASLSSSETVDLVLGRSRSSQSDCERNEKRKILHFEVELR